MMMPVEPGLADTNVLIYALDADAPHHMAARALLEAARDGEAALYVTPQILGEFYAVVTNARRVAKPRSPAEALDAISDLLSFLYVLPVPAHVVSGWMARLVEATNEQYDAATSASGDLADRPKLEYARASHYHVLHIIFGHPSTSLFRRRSW